VLALLLLLLRRRWPFGGVAGVDLLVEPGQPGPLVRLALSLLFEPFLVGTGVVGGEAFLALLLGNLRRSDSGGSEVLSLGGDELAWGHGAAGDRYNAAVAAWGEGSTLCAEPALWRVMGGSARTCFFDTLFFSASLTSLFRSCIIASSSCKW